MRSSAEQGPEQKEQRFKFLSVAVPKPIDHLFTYKISEHLLPQVEVGGWVRVPFGKTNTHAFVVEPPKGNLSDIPHENLKEVLEVGTGGPIFSQDVLALCKWASEYYMSPLGEVLHCAAPPAAFGLKNAKREAREVEKSQIEPFEAHELTEKQKEALRILDEARLSNPSGIHVGLLHGVTGSGKTEIYIELARRTLTSKKGVLVLVPEIALTSQLHQRFEKGLGETVALWHSALADGKRRDIGSALRKGEIRIVVGARSAVFAPIENLGLIIVDEEHDPSYKQEDRVRYHARDLAIVRSKLTRAFTVLGSATPSLETRERVREGRYALARLDDRISSHGLPQIEIVNLCQADKIEDVQAPLAIRTVDAIRETLVSGGQAMVFLNRRGFASFLVCQECGEVNGCPNCSITLTVHSRGARLRCHVCGHNEATPETCAKCKGHELRPIGAGTESLETELPSLIPDMIPLRLDRDQITSATRLESILATFRQGKANVLLGTQMLAKGHDFPGVTLVVVVLADGLFRFPDFRAPERAYQLLKQVSGRAGRADRAGRVLIQTYNVDHPVIHAIEGKLTEEAFLESERQGRSDLGYPPFGRIARLRFESKSRDDAMNRAKMIVKGLSQMDGAGQSHDVLGPSEAFLEKAQGIYRWDVLIKAKEIQNLQKVLKSAREQCHMKKWLFMADIDPYGVG